MWCFISTFLAVNPSVATNILSDKYRVCDANIEMLVWKWEKENARYVYENIALKILIIRQSFSFRSVDLIIVQMTKREAVKGTTNTSEPDYEEELYSMLQ